MEKLWIRLVFILFAISAIPMIAFVAILVFGCCIYYSIADREPIKDVWDDLMDDGMRELWNKTFTYIAHIIRTGEIPDEF